MRAVAALLLLGLLPAGAGAHWPAAAEIVAEVASAPGVVEARRDVEAPRLLVVRVGPGWAALPPARRLAEAEAWRTHWREAVPGGLVAVIDAATARPAVNYDGRGQPRLAPPAPPPGTAATPP